MSTFAFALSSSGLRVDQLAFRDNRNFKTTCGPFIRNWFYLNISSKFCLESARQSIGVALKNFSKKTVQKEISQSRLTLYPHPPQYSILIGIRVDIFKRLIQITRNLVGKSIFPIEWNLRMRIIKENEGGATVPNFSKFRIFGYLIWVNRTQCVCVHIFFYVSKCCFFEIVSPFIKTIVRSFHVISFESSNIVRGEK